MMSLGPRSLREVVFTRLPMIFAGSMEKCYKSLGSKETVMPALTRKQDTFASRIADGDTQSAAYRASYDAAQMDDATVWSEASRLVRHPQVSARVEVLRAEKDHIRRSLVLDHEEAILAQLQHEAFTAKTDGARIRALELLGRHAGMFTERVEVEQVERSVSQIETAIRQRLERLGVA